MKKYQIFISYRRDGGDALAGRLSDRFTALGYEVFYDVESMRSGTFNTQLFDAIDMCKDVLVVLPPGGLDRCQNEDDWVRKELAYAIRMNKNMIPVMMRGFEFPDVLPEEIEKLRYLEGVTASSEYFDAVIARMESLFVSKPSRKNMPGRTAGYNGRPVFQNTLALGLSTLAEGEFLGREEELEQLDRSIRENRNPVIVYGFGGMGKTELVIEYGRRKQTECQVHFVRFEQSFLYTVAHSIADAFRGYDRYQEDGIPKNDRVIFREVMEMLREQSPEDILIIDNVDSEMEEFAELCNRDFDALCQLPMHLIITTRTCCDNGGIEVNALKMAELRNLMGRYVNASKEQIHALIEAVEGHTLTVDLIGRTLKHSIPRITPEEMLDKLKKEGIGAGKFARVASNKDRDRKKRKIEDHLMMLFQLNNLPEEEIRYMEYAYCMPEKGMDTEFFALCCPDFDQDQFYHLLERGWIRLNEEEDIVSIHPLIREITKKASGVCFEHVESFVDQLEYNVNNQQNRVMQAIDIMRRVNDVMSLPEEKNEYYSNIQYQWGFSELKEILGTLSKENLKKISYDFCSLVVENCDKSYTPMWKEGEALNAKFISKTTQILLSIVYRNYLVDPEEREKIVDHDSIDRTFPAFDEKSARKDGTYSYAQWLYLGKTYRILGKLEKAIECFMDAKNAMQKMRNECEKLPQSFLRDFNVLHNLMGNVYIDLEMYHRAFQCMELCAANGFVSGINNLAWLYMHGYGCERDIQKAIFYFERAASDGNNPNRMSNLHLGRIYLGVHNAVPDFEDVNPKKALNYLLRAKELGAADVDGLIEKAKKYTSSAQRKDRYSSPAELKEALTVWQEEVAE